jgi:hypothetical protein
MKERNMKTNLKEIGREDVKLDSVDSAGIVTGCCENSYEHSGSKWREV